MKKNVRRGFTLPEILVTVTVIAVLAAVVVPAVTQYVNKGDAPASSSDIDQVRTAITGFIPGRTCAAWRSRMEIWSSGVPGRNE